MFAAASLIFYYCGMVLSPTLYVGSCAWIDFSWQEEDKPLPFAMVVVVGFGDVAHVLRHNYSRRPNIADYKCPRDNMNPLEIPAHMV